MLLSLLVYSLTGAILFYLGWHVNRREQKLLINGGKLLPFYSWEILLSILIFAIVAGARYHTGYDHAMYLDQYLHLQKTGDFSRHNFEYGFEFISRLFALCNIHYFFYFAFWALLQIGFIYYGLRNHKHLLCWVGLGIMCGSYFLGWMNSVRQSVVVCLFVPIIPFIRDRKFLIYFWVVILAAFIHKSALLLLPLYLLAYCRIEEKVYNRYVLFGVLAGGVILGIIVGAIHWEKYLSNNILLDITGYSNYSNLNDPNVVGKFRILNWGPSRTLILISNALIIWFYPELKAYFKDDKLLPYYFYLSFGGMFLSNLLMNTSHFFLRPVEYFTVFNLVMCAFLMCYLVTKKRYIIGAITFVTLYSIVFIDVIKAVYRPINENQPFLYHFFFAPLL